MHIHSKDRKIQLYYPLLGSAAPCLVVRASFAMIADFPRNTGNPNHS